MRVVIAGEPPYAATRHVPLWARIHRILAWIFGGG